MRLFSHYEAPSFALCFIPWSVSVAFLCSLTRESHVFPPVLSVGFIYFVRNGMRMDTLSIRRGYSNQSNFVCFIFLLCCSASSRRSYVSSSPPFLPSLCALFLSFFSLSPSAMEHIELATLNKFLQFLYTDEIVVTGALSLLPLSAPLLPSFSHIPFSFPLLVETTVFPLLDLSQQFTVRHCDYFLFAYFLLILLLLLLLPSCFRSSL
jgi:hypothetical protein